ncbi:uncharacterized protein LOC131637124 [Vicia villosa]|uniref:uncharacterized protein LOC131637124 n=1 Tax=Vicia villosa TaxID=3911 RepID=UPI00273C56D0|nr:uncharacterized protein LOC131637124 [Vicia villosa]
MGGELSKAVTSSFLALVPKASNPLCLDDYRLICLVGCMYKFMAKILAGRLKCVLNSIVSQCQSAFVPGRQLLDGVLVANEVVDFVKKEGLSCLLFKVDFEKAYDKVSWVFLHFLLEKMGFGVKWREWMELLVFKSDMSVVVNGSPTKEFAVKRGLRQGDPLSPFLFVLVAEALSRLVRKSSEIGEYENLLIKRRCFVDILQFADDTLLIGEGSWKHVKALKVVLRAFELVSGLGINFHKSKLIGVNTSQHFLEAASLYLSCKMESNNFEFLGIPIGFNPRKESTWQPLLEKMRRRLNGWKNRFLNLGGRITLLKSILSSLSIFFMSFYKMPTKVVKECTKIQSNFLWGGAVEKRNIHWWRWRIVNGGGTLWWEVLKARYGDIKMQILCGGDSRSSSSSSLWWRDLLKVGIFSPFLKDPLISNCSFKVGNGFSTPFWEVGWINSSSLSDDFPDLFELSSLKKVSVAVMGGWREGVWVWGDLGISGAEVAEKNLSPRLAVLRGLLEDFGGLIDDIDSVCWVLDSEKCFSVSSCYRWYASLRTPFGPLNKNEEALELIWMMEIPFKIKAFAWRIFVNRLPTKDLLVYRGINFSTSNLNCFFCDSHLEDLDHMFFKCEVVKTVWNEIGVWLDYPNRKEFDCIPSFMEWYVMGRVKGIKVGKLGVFWLATCWIIWLTRNGFCFRNEAWNINNIVWNIKILIWRWSFLGDIAYPNCSFYDFSKDPISILS